MTMTLQDKVTQIRQYRIMSSNFTPILPGSLNNNKNTKIKNATGDNNLL